MVVQNLVKRLGVFLDKLSSRLRHFWVTKRLSRGRHEEECPGRGDGVERCTWPAEGAGEGLDVHARSLFWS